MVKQQDNDLHGRVTRLEMAVWGSPDENGKSKAIVPTLRRWLIYANAAHWAAKALLASIPAAAAALAIGRTLAWW